MVRLGKEKLPHVAQLAATCGVEHLTAILADKILNGWMLSGVDPQIRSLWEWHSAEELEHKSVAFDRILDSENTSMTLKSLGAIADLFGKRLVINLVDV